jgi:superoxide dismutase, Fe-Mn family
MTNISIMNSTSNYRRSLTLILAPVLFTLGCASNPSTKGHKVSTEERASSPIVYNLPKLPYAYNALEPHVDARTMEIHYDKHHRGYVTNLNKALEGSDLASTPLEEILAMNDLPLAIRNNGGGHYNHALFWTVMSSPSRGGGVLKAGKLKTAIEKEFGSLEKLQSQFNKAALTRFGSGWAWLVVTPAGKLAITSTNAQDNPLMKLDDVVQGTPVLGLDVWEHAYYLKYQNKRADYINAWWKVVNWSEVERRFSEANSNVSR